MIHDTRPTWLEALETSTANDKLRLSWTKEYLPNLTKWTDDGKPIQINDKKIFPGY